MAENGLTEFLRDLSKMHGDLVDAYNTEREKIINVQRALGGIEIALHNPDFRQSIGSLRGEKKILDSVTAFVLARTDLGDVAENFAKHIPDELPESFDV